MKILATIILILFTLNSEAQRTSVRGYRYDKTIKSNPNLSLYKKGDKKLYVIWEANKVFVYPNPTQGVVYFSQYGDAILMDIWGRILRKEKNVDRMDMGRYASGTYHITLITEDQVSHHLQIKL